MINWDKVYKLSSNEFPENPDELAEPKLIYSLGELRKGTQERMFPSPITGALARFGGSKTSQHYVGESYEEQIRKSTGCDIFCEGLPIAVFQAILGSRLFNGIGIYLDTTGPDGLPWVMFHVDIRKQGFNFLSPLIWFAEKVKVDNKIVTKYRYPQNEAKYWDFLKDERLYLYKKYRHSRA